MDPNSCILCAKFLTQACDQQRKGSTIGSEILVRACSNLVSIREMSRKRALTFAVVVCCCCRHEKRCHNEAQHSDWCLSASASGRVLVGLLSFACDTSALLWQTCKRHKKGSFRSRGAPVSVDPAAPEQGCMKPADQLPEGRIGFLLTLATARQGTQQLNSGRPRLPAWQISQHVTSSRGVFRGSRGTISSAQHRV